MSLLDDLRAVVGPDRLLTDPDLRAPFETDWTGRFRGTAVAVVRPGCTEEIAAVIRACIGHGVAVVPQGGNTGLVGGGVPRSGEVVLSLSRLNDVGNVDPALGQIELGAGTTLATLQARAAEAGLDAGLDFAARDSATIGGSSPATPAVSARCATEPHVITRPAWRPFCPTDRSCGAWAAWPRTTPASTSPRCSSARRAPSASSPASSGSSSRASRVVSPP